MLKTWIEPGRQRFDSLPSADKLPTVQLLEKSDMFATKDTSMNHEFQAVATVSNRKPLLWGLVMMFFGSAWSVGGVIAWREDSLGGAILLGGLGSLFLALGVGRLRAAFGRDWYLCAGPSGLRFRVPTYGLAMMVGGLSIRERYISREQIKHLEAIVIDSWSDWIANALSPAIMIELVSGEELIINTSVFAESQYEIEDNIRRISDVARQS